MHIIKKYFFKPLYRNSIALMLNTGISSIFNFVFWMIAGHTISAKSIGLASAAISAAALLITISWFGLDAGLVRYFPRSTDKSGFYNATILIIILVTLLITAIFLIGLNEFSPAMEFLTGWRFLFIFIGYILITAVCNMQGTALVAVRRADLSLLQSSILVIRIPLLWAISSLSIIGILVSMDLAYLAMLIIGILMLYKVKVSSKPDIDLREVRESFSFSLGNYFAAILTAAPITLMPMIIVNTVGAKEGAYFYIAYSIATFLFMVPDAISMSLFVEGSHRRPLKASAMKSIRFAIMIMAPMALFIIVFGGKLLAIFGPGYSIEAYPLLQLLAISSLFSAIISIYISVKKVQKDIPMVNYISFAVSALTIGLGYLLLVAFGLIGHGYAWLISNVAVCAIAGWMMASKDEWPDKK
jgi:O-antigen/teichoic acid export membrane protein